MGFQDREIERKLVAPSESLSYDQGRKLIDQYIGSRPELIISRVEKGESLDNYWKVKNKYRTFSRARCLDNGIIQLTVKQEDQDGSFNRVELDLETNEPIEKVLGYQNIVHGPMAGTISKEFVAIFLNYSQWDTICCYQIQVDGKTEPLTFIEVEGRSEKWVNEHTENIKKLNPSLQDAKGSLCTMYFNRDDDTPWAPI